jgi:hypothetical protein
VTVRTASWVAWSLWALAVVLEVAAIPLWLANHPILLSRFGTAEDFAPHVFLVPAYPARSLHPGVVGERGSHHESRSPDR